MAQLSKFKTALVLAHAAREVLKISIPAVMKAHFGGLSVKDADQKLRRWSQALLDRVDTRLEVDGLEHASPQKGPYVIVSNHQSLYDIPVLFQALPLSLRMAAKKELFTTPVWGRAMLASGFVEVDRGDRDKAYEALARAATKMKSQGVSLHVAPEGTRSPDGRLTRFKRGAFEIARSTGFYVLPVVIDGAIKIHRKGAETVSTGETVRVKILQPVDPSEFDEVETLRDLVFRRFSRELPTALRSNPSGNT